MNDLKNYVIEFKKQNHQSFDQFYHLTKKSVFFSIVSIIKDENLVEDIMQETYLKFLKNVSQVKESGNVQAYLNQVARNLAIDYYHDRKKIVYDELFIEQQTEELATEDAFEDVFKWLDILNDTEKEIVIQHVINDLKFREIAVLLDKPLGTVLWIYNKAIKKMRKEVEKQHEL